MIIAMTYNQGTRTAEIRKIGARQWAVARTRYVSRRRASRPGFRTRPETQHTIERSLTAAQALCRAWCR